MHIQMEEYYVSIQSNVIKFMLYHRKNRVQNYIYKVIALYFGNNFFNTTHNSRQLFT